jgi:hypothetical protein
MLIDSTAKNLANKAIQQLSHYHNSRVKFVKNTLQANVYLKFDDINFHASHGYCLYKNTRINSKASIYLTNGDKISFFVGDHKLCHSYWRHHDEDDFYTYVFNQEIKDYFTNQVEPEYEKYSKRNSKNRKPPSEASQKKKAIKRLRKFLGDKGVNLSSDEMKVLFDLSMNRYKDLEVKLANE